MVPSFVNWTQETILRYNVLSECLLFCKTPKNLTLVVSSDMNTNRLDNTFQLRWPALIILPFVLLMAVSCVRRKDEPAMLLGSDATLSGAASLICSDECLQRSQCGTIDSRWVVLLNSSGPATESHDFSLPVDAEVTINQQQMAQVQDIMSIAPAWREPFYEVSAPDQSAGWVAGWCIAQEIVP